MPPSLRVVSLNIHKGFSAFNRRFVLHELKQAIQEVDADVVLLQEVISGHRHWAKKHSNWPQENHYEFLADAVWPHYAYGKNAVYPAGDHGNAILSKYPIVATQHLNISTDRLERRGLLYSEIEIPETGKRVHCLCTHLNVLGFGRRKQFRRIVQFINDKIPADAGYILAGDFNDWTLEGHKYLKTAGGFNNVFAGEPNGAAKTFPALFPVLRLDRIYYKNLVPLDSHIYSGKPWSMLSDHCALTARFEL